MLSYFQDLQYIILFSIKMYTTVLNYLQNADWKTTKKKFTTSLGGLFQESCQRFRT